MLKKTYKWISGILLALVVLASGTIYIQSTGERTACRAGWVDLDDGYYKCVTASNPAGRIQLCYDVYNSANTENYWCEKGTLVEQKTEPIINPPSKEGFVCSRANEGGCKVI